MRPGMSAALSSLAARTTGPTGKAQLEIRSAAQSCPPGTLLRSAWTPAARSGSLAWELIRRRRAKSPSCTSPLPMEEIRFPRSNQQQLESAPLAGSQAIPSEPKQSPPHALSGRDCRSEEHTSELQSPDHLVCRLLLEKKK